MKWSFWRRERKPKKLGLALSGGAVRGMAHLGVLEVLEREGIRPDYVAGVSAGALVGALYCAGLPVKTIQEHALELSWAKLGRLIRPRIGFFDSQRMEDYIIGLIGPRQFASLTIPFAAVAVDLMASRTVVLREGSVAEAVRASCALPGIFTPVRKDGRLLVDGGVINNLPVSVAREMGAEYVIAVDLLPPPVYEKEPHNLFDVWSMAFYAQRRLRHLEGEKAECLITPDIGHFSLVDFSSAPALMERGREAAEARIEQIKADLGLEKREV